MREEGLDGKMLPNPFLGDKKYTKLVSVYILPTYPDAWEVSGNPAKKPFF